MSNWYYALPELRYVWLVIAAYNVIRRIETSSTRVNLTGQSLSQFFRSLAIRKTYRLLFYSKICDVTKQKVRWIIPSLFLFRKVE